MDLQTRKINFIQEFLRTADSSLVEKFEKMLRHERKKIFEDNLKPMSIDQYEHRVDEAVEDYKNKRVTDARKLKKEIISWK